MFKDKSVPTDFMQFLMFLHFFQLTKLTKLAYRSTVIGWQILVGVAYFT